METVHSVLRSLWLWLEITPERVIGFLWMLFLLYWLVSALNRKKTKQRESRIKRLGYVLPLLVAFYLLYNGYFDFGLLGKYFAPHTLTVEWIGAAITAAGLFVACWARFHLGANWSGVVTLKEGHELIRTGPYRNIRHPIYTGILLGFLGNVIAIGEVRGLIALAVIWGSFYIKARREESFLVQEFGPKFDEHTRNTGMIWPTFS
jgi:protein-S-isoprenylcysteine O-methyltransferase Ste14